MNNKIIKRIKRKLRIRAKVNGTAERPRLAIYRSNTSLYAQLIDDAKGKTLLGVSEKTVTNITGTKTERAKAVGRVLAEKAKEKKWPEAIAKSFEKEIGKLSVVSASA